MASRSGYGRGRNGKHDQTTLRQKDCVHSRGINDHQWAESRCNAYDKSLSEVSAGIPQLVIVQYIDASPS
jgi:hypothetical protein